jgi:hypothetical protein
MINLIGSYPVKKVCRRLPGNTAPPARPYVHRLGYHSAISHYTGGGDINRFSGTSFNAKIRQREKLEKLQAAAEVSAQTKENAIRLVKGFPVRGVLPAWVYPGLLTEKEVNRIRTKGKSKNVAERGAPKIHLFSDRTKGIVKARSTAFFRSIEGRKIFCTLTFIEDPKDDARAVKILNKFLTVLRKEYDNLNYLWVAERQEKNSDRIHFHLIINRYINIRRFNALWILQQYRAGLKHEKYSKQEVEAHFRAGLPFQKMLNPVDVKKVKNIGVLSSYLSKYISKGNNGGGFACLVWHCSRPVSRLCLRVVVGYDCIELAKGYDNAVVDKKTGEVLKMPQPTRNRDGSGFFYTVWRINNPGRFLPFLRELEQINKWIQKGEFSENDFIEYLAAGIPEEKYRRIYLN